MDQFEELVSGRDAEQRRVEAAKSERLALVLTLASGFAKAALAASIPARELKIISEEVKTVEVQGESRRLRRRAQPKSSTEVVRTEHGLLRGWTIRVDTYFNSVWPIHTQFVADDGSFYLGKSIVTGYDDDGSISDSVFRRREIALADVDELRCTEESDLRYFEPDSVKVRFADEFRALRDGTPRPGIYT